MAERAIRLYDWEVRAFLDGRKSQLRRAITNANSQGNLRASELRLETAWVDGGPSPAGNPGPYLKARVNLWEICAARGWEPDDCDPDIIERLYPRVFPGDLLWGQEAWSLGFEGGGSRDGVGEWTYCVEYRAEGGCKTIGYSGDYRNDPYSRMFDAQVGAWRSSTQMPRWASRLTLRVTEVRAQRLQEITEEDAVAEGCEADKPERWWQGYQVSDGEYLHCNTMGDAPPDWMVEPHEMPSVDMLRQTAAVHFRLKWDAVNRDYLRWDCNPWVWVNCLEVESADV